MPTLTLAPSFRSTAKLLLGLTKFSDDTILYFTEDSDPGNMFGLTLGCTNTKLITAAAKLLGCPKDELPNKEDSFQGGDYWAGEVSFREVADEITTLFGEFFDDEISLGDLRFHAAIDMAELTA